jgi:predicted dehydrogenase
MRFLQVGLGSMGKRRIRCVQALRAGTVVGVDPRPDRRAEAEQLYGIRTASSFEDGLAADPDAVIISTPPQEHVAYALAALSAGKPVFVEETVMLDPDGLDPLLSAVAQSRVLAAPSCTMRFHPAVVEIQRVLRSGEIGRALSFAALCVSYLPDWHPWERVQDFYVNSRASGGGREMVIFDLDWIEWLFGRTLSVSADAGRLSS